jgi:hypothetical protein
MEILISMAILGIIMSALYGSYFVNVDTIASGRSGAKINQRKRILLERLSRDLESLIVTTGTTATELPAGFKGMHEEMEGKSSDWMMFHSLSSVSSGTQSPHLDICKVLYHLVKNPEGKGFTLCRTQGWINNKDFPFKGMTFELDRQVGSLEISYEDEKGKVLRDWGTEEGVHSSLPILIRVRLTLIDDAQREVPLFAVIHPPIADFQQRLE